jgi:DNA polymerase
VEQAADGTPILITTHPSDLLRLPPAERPEAQALFRADLEKAARMLG